MQITGTLRGNNSDVSDWFFFTLDDRDDIVNACVSTTAPILDAGSAMRVTLLEGDTFLGNTTNFLIGGAFGLSPLFTPLDAGTYNVGLQLISGLSQNVDHTISATVEGPAPIPLPAGLPLLLAGLGSFAYLRLRKG